LNFYFVFVERNRTKPNCKSTTCFFTTKFRSSRTWSSRSKWCEFNDFIFSFNEQSILWTEKIDVRKR